VILSDFISDESKVLHVSLFLDGNPNFVILVFQFAQETSIMILKLATDQHISPDSIQNGVVPTAKAKAEELLVITCPQNNIVETHLKKDNFKCT